jgi:hypothetical protein
MENLDVNKRNTRMGKFKERAVFTFTLSEEEVFL